MKKPPTIGQLLDAVDRLASAPPSKADAALRALNKIAFHMPRDTHVARMKKVLTLLDELSEAVDNNANDIGGSRGEKTILIELETAANAARVWALSVGVLDGWL